MYKIERMRVSCHNVTLEIDTIFSILSTLQPRKLQVSKEVVQELEFSHIAVMQIYIICSRVTGILILIGSLGCLKEVKTMEMILGNVNFQIVLFLIFSNICCRYTLELQFQYVPTTYVFSINEIFTISFF